MAFSVASVQNVAPNVRFASALAALTATEMWLSLISSNVTDFQRVCFLCYTKREDVLRSVSHTVPVLHTAYSKV